MHCLILVNLLQWETCWQSRSQRWSPPWRKDQLSDSMQPRMEVEVVIGSGGNDAATTEEGGKARDEGRANRRRPLANK